MAVGDHLGALRGADKSPDRRRIGRSKEHLEVDVAGAGQVALTRITGVTRLTSELAGRPHVENDKTPLAKAALELVSAHVTHGADGISDRSGSQYRLQARRPSRAPCR